MKRSLSCLLVCALVVTCPGFAAYAAAGEMLASPSAGRGAVVPIPASLHAPAVAVPIGLALPGVSAGSRQAPAAASPVSAERALEAGAAQLAEAKGPEQARGILGRIFSRQAARGDVSAETLGVEGSGDPDLAPSDRLRTQARPPSPPAPRQPSSQGPSGPGGSRVAGVLKALGRVALAGGAVVALQWAAGGLVPAAAVWAVSSAVLLLPAALYSRVLLGQHDSSRLRKVKWAMDAAIGALLGAVAIAVHVFPAIAGASVLSGALPLAAAAGGGTLLATMTGGRLLDLASAGAALFVLPALVGVGGLGAIGVGPILGMMALPAMTTISFFLGSIVKAAESGEPFSVPGSIQKIRFPSFNWVMIGAVFALVSGYSAVYTNAAFVFWMILGGRSGQNPKPNATAAQKVMSKLLSFDAAFLIVAAIVIATGFASPLTFLFLTFLPERAAVWTEALLTRWLPAGQPAPSTASPNVNDGERAVRGLERLTPNFHHWARTFALLGLMLGLGAAMGPWVFGFHSLIKNLGVGALFAALPFFFSNVLVKAMMKAQPTDEARDPEFFGIMKELRQRINAKRAAKGKKPIPMPEMVNIPMDAPNAFATGRDPFHATVGVTVGIKDMLLNPESLRQHLVALLTAADPSGKPFKVFRRAIAGSVAGITEASTREETAQAVLRAAAPELKALGARLLRGVLGHEFSHVMDRHMLTGSIGGAISTGVAFASYGVMWSVGHAQKIGGRLKNLILGRTTAAPSGPADQATEVTPGDSSSARSKSRPEALDPLSTGILLKSMPALLRVFAALWGPVIIQIIQMAGSRNNEAQADEDGASLTDDPAALALSLGLLMTWKPKQMGFVFPFAKLPGLAAVSHLFTVNPLQQLEVAGALPQPDATTEWMVGKRDNWLLNLFITHPDTRWRIETLYDLSRVKDDRPKPPPQPPSTGGGGDLSPPTAFVAPGAGVSQQGAGGVAFLGDSSSPLPAGAPGLPVVGWAGLPWRLLLSLPALLRVLPDKERNREFWKFTLGQALLTLGVNFHNSALTRLASPTGDPSKLSWNRTANWSAQAASSLTTGPLVDRNSVGKTIVWTHLGRGLIILVVPLLFFHGYLTFAAFLLVVFLHGLVQSTCITAGSVAFNRILGPDQDYYNRANAVFNLIMNAVGVVVPLLAGAFIGALDARLGLLAGNALAFAVYGAALIAVAVGYGFFLKVPRDEVLQARHDLAARLKGRPGVKGVRSGRSAGKTALVVEVAGDPSDFSDLPREFSGYPVVVARASNVWKELAEGFRLVRSNRFLKWSLLASILPAITGDAMLFLALPRFIKDVLGQAGLPAVGWASQASAFGFYLSADALGLGLASILMWAFHDRSTLQWSSAVASFAKEAARLRPDIAPERWEAAQESLREAPDAVLASYRKAWESDPEATFDERRFASDLRAEVERRLAESLFDDEASGEAESLAGEAGLRGALSVWSSRFFAKLSRSSRRQAETGIDALQRQGRWSAVLQALGWLACFGVFLTPSLWASTAWMLVSLVLEGPAVVIWASLTQRVLAESMPEDMGKVYSFTFFAQLLFSVLGLRVFGSIMTRYPTHVGLWIFCGVCALCAVAGFSQTLIFPRRRRSQR